MSRRSSCACGLAQGGNAKSAVLKRVPFAVCTQQAANDRIECHEQRRQALEQVLQNWEESGGNALLLGELLAHPEDGAV